MQKPKILFRADGDSRIGLGHVYRSIALLHMLSGHFTALFATRNPLPEIRSLLSGHCEIIALSEEEDLVHEGTVLGELAAAKGAFCVVLDGYQFDAAYQQAVKSRMNSKLVCIDDIHAFHFVADVVINHGGGAKRASYSAEPFTRFHLGTKYSLLAAPFRNIALGRSKRRINDQNVLICFGSADPDNVTLTVLQSCIEKEPKKKFFVVTGAAYGHGAILQEFKNNTTADILLINNVPPSEMVGLMVNCGVAVCAPSGVAYEYLSVGGELYLRKTAANQTDLMNYLISEGLAFSFEDFRLSGNAVRDALRKQEDEFDGKSESRLQRIFLSLYYSHTSMIRKVTAADRLALFEWANDAETRRLAFAPRRIELHEHNSWFLSKMNDPNAYLYILDIEGAPAGQVRFDAGTEAVISYAIGKQFRGFGLGLEILKKGIVAFRRDSNFRGCITGYVKGENAPSKSVFQRLGFNEEHFSKPDVLKYSKFYE